MCTQIVQCDSNYLAVRSLQINIIEDISCGERSHNRCWYLHLYSVNIKSKHRWYPNISFGMLHCSIILSLSLSLSIRLSKICWPYCYLGYEFDNDRQQVKYFPLPPKEYFVEQTGILFMVCREKWVSQLWKPARYSVPSFPAYIIKRLSGIS